MVVERGERLCAVKDANDCERGSHPAHKGSNKLVDIDAIINNEQMVCGHRRSLRRRTSTDDRRR
jgi:hypothetical protein